MADDYSRAVWAYMIKTKDAVGFYIQNFVELIFTRFDKKVKIFRSNNRTEFVNNKMATFFSSKGIFH